MREESCTILTNVKSCFRQDRHAELVNYCVAILAYFSYFLINLFMFISRTLYFRSNFDSCQSSSIAWKYYFTSDFLQGVGYLFCLSKESYICFQTVLTLTSKDINHFLSQFVFLNWFGSLMFEGCWSDHAFTQFIYRLTKSLSVISKSSSRVSLNKNTLNNFFKYGAWFNSSDEAETYLDPANYF